MKKITFMLIMLVASPAAVAQDNDAKAGKIIEIDQEQFIELIADTNNPDWVFKGQRPAVVDFNAA